MHPWGTCNCSSTRHTTLSRWITTDGVTCHRFPGSRCCGDCSVTLTSIAHGIPNNSASLGERSGRHGINPWEKSGRKHDMKSQPMQRWLRNNLSFRYDYSQWTIPGAIRVQSRQPKLNAQVQVSSRKTNQGQLGGVVWFLAWTHSNWGQAPHPPRKMDYSPKNGDLH